MTEPGRFKTRAEYEAWIAAGRPPEAPVQPPGTTLLSGHRPRAGRSGPDWGSPDLAAVKTGGIIRAA
jgi:hypothetical protein